jgi:hypothetical protein
MRLLIHPGSSYDETEETASEVRLGGASNDPVFFGHLVDLYAGKGGACG